MHNPGRPGVADLGVNAIPDFSLVVGYGRRRIASAATTPGCPFLCTFCSVSGMYGSTFRTHSIDRVIAELKTHARTPFIFFADDIFPPRVPPQEARAPAPPLSGPSPPPAYRRLSEISGGRPLFPPLG